MKVRWVLAAAALVLFLSASARAATLRAVGVLGSSGEAGSGLVRCGPFPLERAASGVALDADWTLWLSGGDRINRVGLDGRLVESFPLVPKGSVVDSRTFAILDGTLYFFGHRGGRDHFLYALPMRPGANAEPLPVKLPERKRPQVPYCLAPQPLGGRLVLATESKEAEGDRIGIYLLDPRAKTLRQAFALAGSYPHGLAVDARRSIIYVGANFGLFVGGITHSHVYAITAVRPDGTAVSDAFPAPCTKTPATPTQFRGIVSLAGGALWDSAWYGFLARLDLEGRGAPGRIVEWHHELDYVTQVLGVRDGGRRHPTRDPLVIATRVPDAFYFAVWERAGENLRLVRRIGCLPTIASLGLSQDGWVTVGTARAQLWWQWDDAADAPPRKAGLHVALTPPFFRGEQFFAIAAQYRLSRVGKVPFMSTVFSHRVGARNEARRVGKPPMKRPVGLAVQAKPGAQRAAMFVTDAATKQIWRRDLSLPNLHPAGKPWEPVRIEGYELRLPTDVAALADGRLLVGDEGRIVMLAPRGGALGLEWQWERWGDAPGERFGKRLRFAVDGRWMLIADTERHRVLWADWLERRILAQLGDTDHAGDDARHLSRPTFVALRGTRAVVADAGNQRVLKLTLNPALRVR